MRTSPPNTLNLLTPLMIGNPLKQSPTNATNQDLLLPRTQTSRLARGMLPANTSLQKDAILALTKSATVFISYVASTANEQRPNAKTITPADVLNALREIEMGGVMELDGPEGEGRLERELAVFEEVIKGKRKGYREKVKARESAGGVGGEKVGEGEAMEGVVERGEPDAKKARRMSGEEDEGAQDEDVDDLLDAQLNGGLEDAEEEEDEAESDDQEEEDDDEDNEEQDADETKELEEDVVDVEGGRRRSGRRSSGGRPLLAPNGRDEVGASDDESD
jgi:DNA polymerase epsilon subunit 3